MLSEDHVSETIREEVIDIVRGQFLEMFASIKTAIIEHFDECYVASVETVAVAAIAAVTTGGGGAS